MLKKFLAFFGLTEVTLTDGTAKVELTEAQMTASGQIIADLEAAQAELKSEKEINVTAQNAHPKALMRYEARIALKPLIAIGIEAVSLATVCIRYA